jgi:2-dehydropantoate 2-reductase
MKIVIFGSGGVGGYYGARLQQAGNEVVFVARGEHARAMREHGLHIRSELGDMVAKVEVSEAPVPADLVIVAVKLWDSETASQAIAKVVRPDTSVMSLQNGVDKDDVLAAAMGAQHVVGGMTHIGAVIEEPGVIAHTGKLARITLGELSGGTSERVERIAAELRKAGVETKVSDDMRRSTWEKFCFLTSFSGLTAMTRKSIGEVRANAVTRAFFEKALHEAAQVARGEGVRLPESFEQQQMTALDSLPGAMTSSMAQDLARARRLELPWLSGAVVRRAKKRGLATPAHEAIEAALVLHQRS